MLSACPSHVAWESRRVKVRFTASMAEGDPLKASRVFPSASASAADCAWTKECKRQPLAKEYKNQGDETPLAINSVRAAQDL